MARLDLLARDGAIEVLRRLCLREARFKELNESVSNTRTLTRRLNELWAEGLIQKVGVQYKITVEGFDAVLALAELAGKVRNKILKHEELAKITQGWIRISLSRLTELLHEEFGDELVSFVVYGSLVQGSFQLGGSDIDLLYILQDGSTNVWQREGNVFSRVQSTWEYKAADYWLKRQGLYGYTEVTTAWLQKSYARKLQPVFLDMLSHRAVLYDREGFFQNVMQNLEKALQLLGTIRIERPDGTYLWFLKPDIIPGELIDIDLG